MTPCKKGSDPRSCSFKYHHTLCAGTSRRIAIATKYNSHFLSQFITISTPLIWVKTLEDNRMMREAIDSLIPGGILKNIYTWDASQTLTLCQPSRTGKAEVKAQCKTALEAINWFIQPPEETPAGSRNGEDDLMAQIAGQSSALFLFDTAENMLPASSSSAYCAPVIPRVLKKAERTCTHWQKPIIIVSHTSEIPASLSRNARYACHELPTEAQYTSLVKQSCVFFARTADDVDAIHKIGPSELDRVVGQIQGMTQTEAENILAQAAQANLVKREQDPDITKEFDSEVIHSERVQRVKKSSSLEIIKPDGGLDLIGGLPELKQYFGYRRQAFEPEWLAEGLSLPKGVVLAGLSGTGKTLISKCLGQEWDATVIRGDVGACKGGLVGESERNFRDMLSDVESLAGRNSRVVFQLDEAGKMFGGGLNGGGHDSGVSSGISATFLTWRQNCKKPVYVVMTCNEDLVNFPPEWIRPGRIDKVFFVDVPDADGRKEVLKIHLKMRAWSDEEIDLQAIADLTEGWTPAELEQLVTDAIAIKLSVDGFRPAVLQTRHLMEAAKNIVPMTISNAKEIAALREFAVRRGYPGVRHTTQTAKKKAKPEAEMGRRMVSVAANDL